MKIVSFQKKDGPALGVLDGNEVIDLSAVAKSLPRDLKTLLQGGSKAMGAVKKAAADAKPRARLAAGKVKFLPPIANPTKIVCLGLNYRDHAIETNNPIPKHPIIFLRTASTLTGHKSPMLMPAVSKMYDYEAELAVIIGKRGYRLKKDKALSIVAGYSCFNDGSVRDYQLQRGPQWTLGKNFNGSGGFGPCFVTADSLPKGASPLRISCRLNGETVQDSSTEQHIFDVPTAIEAITEVMTLEPGDVIIMGTPNGVGSGRKPPLWMKPGDVCEIEIEGIGVLRNPIKAA
jgi:2-keto-4-pentenoate hydratase/2-oxohepta-3-ene-1,7-dioic acid hydratase in catechol pathway